MTTKVVIRVLDAGGRLLGWTEVQARMRDGALWSPQSTILVPIEASGEPAEVSHHWADLDVEWRTPLRSSPLAPGHVFALTYQAELLRVGSPNRGLPATTTRSSVTATVPVGMMGAAGRV